MNLLLDTQAFLWFILDDDRLSQVAREAIVSTIDEVFVSPASAWEIAIKISLGKYELPAPIGAFWESQLLENGFKQVPIELSHFEELSRLPLHHRDPFDRLIIAQARVERLPVVSVDRAFDAYGIDRIW